MLILNDRHILKELKLVWNEPAICGDLRKFSMHPGSQQSEERIMTECFVGGKEAIPHLSEALEEDLARINEMLQISVEIHVAMIRIRKQVPEK